MKIVNVAVIDLTRPVEQKGFKSFALLDFTQANDVAIVNDTKALSAYSAELKALASAYFANGGSSLIVGGKDISSASSDIPAFLTEVLDKNDFYVLSVVMPKANQKEYLAEIAKYMDGNERICVQELNGTADEVIAAIGDLNTDRVVIYGNSKDTQDGKATAVAGVCVPQDEGSITWGNKAVVGTPVSGYSASDEAKLLDKNINYITKEKGFIISQFGRTLSGSNADITRSKDWLKNRCAEALTSALVNNKKIPYTTEGMAMVSSALNQVGLQAVNMGMLDTFLVVTPKVSEIPTTDKANRVLRGVKFIATLSGAIETIEMELQVKL